MSEGHPEGAKVPGAGKVSPFCFPITYPSKDTVGTQAHGQPQTSDHSTPAHGYGQEAPENGLTQRFL